MVPIFFCSDSSNYLLLFSPLLVKVSLIDSFAGNRYPVILAYAPNHRKMSTSSSSSSSSANTNLAHYLAGLIEGDGSFITPKSETGSIGKSLVASIQVIFAIKDRPSAELLRQIFGGNIYKSGNKNCVRWMIQDLGSVMNIVNIINGKLRTPKIQAFYRMIDFINKKNENKNVFIEKLPLDTSLISSNAWLAGFIDADGHFGIKGFTSNPRTYLAIQFYLPQRCLDLSGLSMELIMSKIAEFLMTKLNQNKSFCKTIKIYKSFFFKSYIPYSPLHTST